MVVGQDRNFRTDSMLIFKILQEAEKRVYLWRIDH